MSKHIFISHSSRDLALTETICRYLESRNQPCWYSERDLDKSKPYFQDELMKAIDGAAAFVLVLTAASLASGEVLNEIANASNKNMQVVLYYGENIPLTEKYLYYLRKYEWIPAHSMPQKEALELMGQMLGVFLAQEQTPALQITENPLLLHENICFAGIRNGGFGVGYDKCLISPGSQGWSPEDVFVERVDRTDFTFASIGKPELDAEYEKFLQSEAYLQMEDRGDNRTRWMLSGTYQNSRLFLRLTKTQWSQTTFWWNQVRQNSEMQSAMAWHTFRDQIPFYPNSFCLHAIVETADNLLVCTRVSNNKQNDYATTIAATIGEQLNERDLSAGDRNNNRFIYYWCSRAMQEEFKFSPEEYRKYVDEDALRVLGLNYEGDIYNFSVPVYIKLNLTFEGLLAHCTKKPANNEEFTEITAMTREAVERLLWQAGDPLVAEKYHPSSFLRMLQFLLYRYPETFAEKTDPQ